jgi:hypothetical protein
LRGDARTGPASSAGLFVLKTNDAIKCLFDNGLCH